ncbi:hypothetical protein CDAR_108641 [Caerostris darwini]|uniref:Uncharacterized protein n=1 Tax=Caerostris darwini TaxID=1538125 RepID=A0AAV4UIR2_9ARAC|nr:hypothetical protein CDAR_108641 [Caerostris darwini]
MISETPIWGKENSKAQKEKTYEKNQQQRAKMFRSGLKEMTSKKKERKTTRGIHATKCEISKVNLRFAMLHFLLDIVMEEALFSARIIFCVIRKQNIGFANEPKFRQSHISPNKQRADRTLTRASSSK